MTNGREHLLLLVAAMLLLFVSVAMLALRLAPVFHAVKANLG